MSHNIAQKLKQQLEESLPSDEFFRPEVFNSGAPDLSDGIMLWCGGRPVNCRVFSSSPGLCPLDARGTRPQL